MKYLGLIAATSIILIGIYLAVICGFDNFMFHFLFFFLPGLYFVAISSKNEKYAKLICGIWVGLAFLIGVFLPPKQASDGLLYVAFMFVVFLHITGFILGVKGISNYSFLRSNLLKNKNNISKYVPNIYIFIGISTAILMICSEIFLDDAHYGLITICILFVYIFAGLKRNLELCKTACFAWVVFAFSRSVMYTIHSGQISELIISIIGLVIDTGFLWVGIHGLILYEEFGETETGRS